MKKEIKDLNVARLRNGAHFLYMKKVLTRAKADPAVVEKGGTYLTDFEGAVEQEDANLYLSKKSQNTDFISAGDQDRDALYSGYKQSVQNFLGLSDGPLSEAARVLWQQIVDYGIDTKMQLDLETGLLVNFIADLEGKYAAQVETLGLGVMVSSLKASNEKVIEMTEARDEERMGKTVGALKAARKRTDDCYRLFVKTINAYAWIEGDAELSDFMDYVNVQVKHYKEEALGQKPGSEEGLPEEDVPSDDSTTGGTEGETTPDTGENNTPEDGDSGEGGTTPPPTTGGNDDDEEVVG